jgi:hypothetical protein
MKMTNDLRKAAEMALGALTIQTPEHWLDKELQTKAIQALRQALAQTEQEKYVTEVVAMHEDGTYTTKRTPIPKREWVGLTESDIYEAMDFDDEFEFARAIEAKLKEKNRG